MNMVIGFGQTEIEEACRIIDECIPLIGIRDIADSVKEVELKYSILEKEYSKLDRGTAPERYSYFFAHTWEIYEGYCIVEFTFHHINRRHPASPDGWALWQTKWMVAVKEDEPPVIYQQI